MEFYTSEGIYADPKHPYTQALLSAIPPESPFEKSACRSPAISGPIGGSGRLPARRPLPALHGALQKEIRNSSTPETDIWWHVSYTNNLPAAISCGISVQKIPTRENNCQTALRLNTFIKGNVR